MPETGLSLRGLSGALLRSHPPAHFLDLRLDRLRLRVQSNSPELIGELGRYFNGFLASEAVEPAVIVTALEAPPPALPAGLIPKEPDLGKTGIKYEYLDLPDGRVVRKCLTGMVFLLGHPLHLAVGPCLEDAGQVVNFVNHRLIQWELDQGSLLAHAAGVALGERGLALAGFSGAGKSTLALHLLSQGLSFVSNDRLMIRDTTQGLIMAGVPKLPRINPGTALNNPDLAGILGPEERKSLAALGPEELWSLEQKHDVFLDECFGPDRFRLTSPLSGLVLLTWRPDGRAAEVARVDLGSRPDLLSAFKKPPGVFFQPGDRPPDLSDRAYLRLLAAVPAYEIGGGVDFDLAVSACLGWLGG